MLQVARCLVLFAQCSLLSGYLFIYFYVLEESGVVAQKSSIRKVFLNIPQDSQENICAGDSFAKKLPAGGLQLH